jgi:hypothetical protein
VANTGRVSPICMATAFAITVPISIGPLIWELLIAVRHTQNNRSEVDVEERGYKDVKRIRLPQDTDQDTDFVNTK